MVTLSHVLFLYSTILSRTAQSPYSGMPYLTASSCFTELSRGGFSKCRFARDGSLDFYTAVNVGGVGWVLRWRQDELGELVYRSRVKVLDMSLSPMRCVISTTLSSVYKLTLLLLS